MYRFFTSTCLLRRAALGLGLVALLSACNAVDTPAPQPSAAVVAPSQDRETEHKLAWEGLIIQVPARATFQPLPSVAAPATNGLPLVAAGAITYSDPAATKMEPHGTAPA